jgi:hypothetical protein
MNGLIISPGQAAEARLKEWTDQAQSDYFDSVRPIYWATQSGTAEAIGSSFLLQVDGRRFLVTAAHVLDLNQQSTLYVGGRQGLELINGNANVTNAPVSGRRGDKYDFAFMELTLEFAERLGIDAFIDVSKIASNSEPKDGRCFMALGYPASRNKPKPIALTGTHVRAQLWAYSATVHTDPKIFENVGASETTHLLLKYGKKSKAFTGEVTNSIKPQGASGGILVELGRMSLQSLAPTTPSTPRLAGVLIENHIASKTIVAVMIQLVVEAIRRS